MMRTATTFIGSFTVNAKGAPAVSNELDYERVLGKRDQLELAVPFGWVQKDAGE
jgi:hypothetical protein